MFDIVFLFFGKEELFSPPSSIYMGTCLDSPELLVAVGFRKSLQYLNKTLETLYKANGTCLVNSHTSIYKIASANSDIATKSHRDTDIRIAS